jgi:hypothetical protein
LEISDQYFSVFWTASEVIRSWDNVIPISGRTLSAKICPSRTNVSDLAVGSQDFLLQNSAILRNSARIRFPETPSVSNDAHAGEKALG